MLLRLGLCTLLTALATAQDAVSPPALRIEIDGPAGIRRAFLPTNLGSMLAGEEARGLWPEMFAGVRQLWTNSGGEGDDYDAYIDVLLAYDGQVQACLWLDPVKDGERTDLRTTVIVTASADDDVDMAALADGATHLLRATGYPKQAVAAPGGNLPALMARNGMGVTLPRLLGQQLVTVWSTDLADALGDERMPARMAFKAQVAGKRAPIGMHLDLSQLVQIAKAESEAKGKRDYDEFGAASEFFGLSSLRELRLSAWPAGPHVALELSMDFEGNDRGAFAGTFPSHQGLPGLLRLAPTGDVPWKAGYFSTTRFYDAGINGLAAWSWSEDMDTPKEMRAFINENLQVDFEADLIDHLSDEVLVVGNLWDTTGETADEQEEVEEADTVNGLCLAWGIKGDAAAFARGWEKIFDVLGPFILDGRDIVEERAGVPIHHARYEYSKVDAYWATSGRMFLFALGDKGLQRLTDLLDAEGKARWSEPFELPESLARLSRYAPPGLNGVARADSRVLLAHQMRSFVDEMLQWAELPVLDEVQPVTTAWKFFVPLLEKYSLETVSTFTGYDQGTWRFRVVW